MKARSPERVEYLTDLLDTAIDHQGYGAFSVREWGDGYAVIVFHESGEDGGTHRVTLDTMARGLGVIRDAKTRMVDDGDGYGPCPVPHNAVTGERLFFGGDARRELLLSDRTNSKDGDYDVIGALAVLECALFGKVVYG